MAYKFFKPTKFKILVFVVLSAALFYLPVVPVLNVPVVAPDVIPASQWTMAAPSVFFQTVQTVGSNAQSFGIFAGTQAGVLNIIYMLVVGYVLACILLYAFHKFKG
jgi:hypothetical protein